MFLTLLDFRGILDKENATWTRHSSCRLGADVSELRSLKYISVPQKSLQEQTSVSYVLSGIWLFWKCHFFVPFLKCQIFQYRGCMVTVHSGVAKPCFAGRREQRTWLKDGFFTPYVYIARKCEVNNFIQIQSLQSTYWNTNPGCSIQH